jgi:hypothetical protein
MTLLSSCYPIFDTFIGIKPIGRYRSDIIYYQNISSWIGRSIEDMINSWGKHGAIIVNYGDKTYPPFENLEKGQKVYEWTKYGFVVQTEEEIDNCIESTFFGTHLKCETKNFICTTEVLVDDSSYIIDVKPMESFINDCVEGVERQAINFPEAP